MQGIATKHIINILLGTHYLQKAREGVENPDPTPVFSPVCENPQIYFYICISDYYVLFLITADAISSFLLDEIYQTLEIRTWFCFACW